MKGWHQRGYYLKQRESDDNFLPIPTVSSRELNCHHIRGILTHSPIFWSLSKGSDGVIKHHTNHHKNV